MVTHYSLPQIRITCGSYQLENYHTDTQVSLLENAVNQCAIIAADTKGETFLNKADLLSNIKVEMRFADKSSTWRQIFGGWVTDLSPTLTEQGELVTIKARGYEEALLAMLVGEQYGNQSSHPTLNKIYEVLTDASYGIIPKWVQKVLNTATDSGYTVNTTKVADVTSDFKYLYWAYKPAINCLDDMIDLISAANTPNAGVHWTSAYSDTTVYLCLATIGNHENPPADVWTTWWNTDQAGSTLEVQKDMIISNFRKQKPQGNYILYHGKLRKPGDGDFWTENQHALWGKTGVTTLSSDNAAGNYKTGAYSLKGTATIGDDIAFWYPSAKDAAWDIENWGGLYNIPTISFWIKRDAGTQNNTYIYLITDAGANHCFYRNYTSLTANTWYNFEYKLGPYSDRDPYNSPWTVFGSPDWGNINYVYFLFDVAPGNTGVGWVDGLSFNGHVLRGARDDTKIGTQKAITKLITDDVGKDDSGVATDDSYVMAQLTKAELYRAVTTPILGEIVIPGQETIMPG